STFVDINIGKGRPARRGFRGPRWSRSIKTDGAYSPFRLEPLIFTQVWTARETNKTQALPTISAIWASGRWVCLGLFGSISRTQFRTQADVVCSSPNDTQTEWLTPQSS